MTQPAISVIVPVYNRAEDLRALLSDLRSQTGINFEVIVADDGSPTPIREVLAGEAYPYPITWCRHEANHGAGAARNTALDAARADIILFIDSDGRVRDPECLRKHHDFQTGVRPLGIPAKAPFVLHGHIDGIHHNYAGKTFYYSNWFMSMGKRWALMRSTHAPTHNTSVPRAVFDRVGKFDPKFCLAEDADWSIRCVKAGVPLVYTPEISLGHRDRDSMADVLRGYERMGEYSVQVRLKNPTSRYGFLFPRRRATAVFLIPLLVVLITVYIAWQCLLKSPRGLLYLPGMLLANIAYGAGNWKGLAQRHRPSRGASQPVFALLLVMAIAGAVRLYRIGEQSLWFDEFNALLHDKTATLGAYLDYIHSINPDHLPLYFTFIYAWMKYAGGEVLGLRLFSIAMGCLSILPLYAFASRIFNRRAGLIAAMCLALSPFDVYRHTSIRSEAFVGLLAATSLYLTVRCGTSRSRGLIVAHAALNSLLIYTHLSMVGLAGLQFLYLAYAWRVDAPPQSPIAGLLRHVPARLLLWSALHLPIAIRVLLWFGEVNSNGVTWYTLPTAGQWLNDLLGDAMVTLNTDFIMTPLYFQLGDVAQRDVFENVLGVALMAYMAAALAWGVLQLARQRPVALPAARAKSPYLLLLLVAVGPVLGLSAVSLLWEPVLLPRYTTFASLALFTLLGGMLAAIPRPRLRRAAIAVLVALCAVQLHLLLANHARSDWLGVGDKIAVRASSDDIVLGMGLFPNRQQSIPRPIDILRRNMPPNTLRMYDAQSIAGIVDESARCMSEAAANTPSRSWIVIEDWTFFPQRTDLERELKAHGLSFNPWQSTNLYLYEVSRDGLGRAPVLRADRTGDSSDDEALLQYFVPRSAPSPSREELIEALRWGVSGLPLSGDQLVFIVAVFKAMELSPETGQRMSEQASAGSEYFNPVDIIRGLASLAEGNYDTAREQFARARDEDVRFIDTQVPGFLALFHGDYAQAKATIAADLKLNPGRIPSFFRYLAGVMPPPCGSRLVPLP